MAPTSTPELCIHRSEPASLLMAPARRVARNKDRNGEMGDIVRGHSSLEPYIQWPNSYPGKVPGHYANRIGRVISRLTDKGINLLKSEGTNMLGLLRPHCYRDGRDPPFSAPRRSSITGTEASKRSMQASGKVKRNPTCLKPRAPTTPPKKNRQIREVKSQSLSISTVVARCSLLASAHVAGNLWLRLLLRIPAGRDLGSSLWVPAISPSTVRRSKLTRTSRS